MKTIEIKTFKANQTQEVGETISRSLYPGSGALFTGELGTGKTTLISGICRGLKVQQQVKSPTFVLVWAYQGKVPVYHVDLFRLSDYHELENVGWEEMVEDRGIYLVEWADRFELPYTGESLKIHMDYGPKKDTRIIKITFDENIFNHLKKDLKQLVDSWI